LLEKHDGFDADSYRRNFAPYLWTHIRGFRELLDALLLERHFETAEMVTEYVRAARVLVLPKIPDDWKKTLTKNAHWNVCSGEQISRICEGAPARLDRSCQAIMALDIAFTLAQHPDLKQIRIYDYVRLAPAIYAVRNLSPAAKAWLKGGAESEADKDRFKKLVGRLCQKDGQDEERDRNTKAGKFLGEAACGYAMTFQNAAIIKSSIKSTWGTPHIELLANRVEGRPPFSKAKKLPPLRCCIWEAEFINLEADKFVKLRKLVGRSGQAGL
jgi:hypothetical protein